MTADAETGNASESTRPLPRDFWMLWGATALSNLGDGIRLTALPLLAALLSDRPLDVALVTTATFTPWVLMSLPAGAIIDRVDRKWLIVSGQLARSGVIGLVAVVVAIGGAELWIIYAAAFVLGLGEVFVDNAAQASIPQLASKDDLELANSRLNMAEILTNDLAGGPIGGFLFAVAASLPFLVDSATFLIGAVLVLAIRSRLEGERMREPTTLRRDIREGWTFLWSNALLKGLALAAAGANFTLTAATSLFVLLATDDLGLSEAGFGLLFGVGALGGLAGSAAAPRLVDRFGRRTTLIGAVLLLGLSTTGTGLAPSPIVAAVTVFGSSFGVLTFSIIGQSLRQAVTPEQLLGRVVSTYRLIGLGAVPLGALAGGILANVTGVRTTYVAAGASVLVIAFVAARVVTPERLAGLSDSRSDG